MLRRSFPVRLRMCRLAWSFAIRICYDALFRWDCACAGSHCFSHMLRRSFPVRLRMRRLAWTFAIRICYDALFRWNCACVGSHEPLLFAYATTLFSGETAHAQARMNLCYSHMLRRLLFRCDGSLCFIRFSWLFADKLSQKKAVSFVKNFEIRLLDGTSSGMSSH